MAGRIVLFKGELETINLFSRELGKGFQELGNYEIFEFDLQNVMKSLGKLYAFMQQGPITAMIAFNSTFYGTTLPSGVSLCEALKIPCINILVDHPYWYPYILEKMPSTGVILCVDRGHMSFVNRFYPGIAINGFLPHGGAEMTTDIKPIAERSIDVFYAGSLYADYAERQKPDFARWSFDAEGVCNASIRLLLEHPGRTIEDVLEDMLHRYGVEMADAELAQFISSCVYIERVVSSHFREKILASVAGAGISLELYGDGWDGCDWIGLPNVHYGGMIPPTEVLNKMEDAKIVLNTLPWFKDGSHERVFNGMLRGAVVCSETSEYFAETLPPEAWMAYDLSEDSIRELPRRIQNLLRDEDRMQQMATEGYRLASGAHTWQARARELHEDLLSLWE